MSLLNNVINVLKDLIGFILGCDYSKIISSGSKSSLMHRQSEFSEAESLWRTGNGWADYIVSEWNSDEGLNA